MKKFCLILLATCLLACNDSSSSVNLNNSLLSNDLKLLLNSTPNIDKSTLPFNTEASITESKQKQGYYVVSVVVSYKDVIINDICLIAIPSSYTLESTPSAVASVGYDEYQFKLAATTNVEKYQFSGFRISYLVDNNIDGVKVLMKAQDYNPIMYTILYSEFNKL